MQMSAQQDSKVDLVKQLLLSKQSTELPEANDLNDMRVSSKTYSKLSGVTHIYFQQEIYGIPVHNAFLDAHMTRDNNLLSFNNRFVTTLKNSALNLLPTLTDEQAIKAAAAALGYSKIEKLRKIESKGGLIQASVFDKGNLSLEDIPVQLIWQPIDDNAPEAVLRLAWDLSIYEIDAQNWWSVRIDAQTGELLDKINWVVHCGFAEDPKRCAHSGDEALGIEHMSNHKMSEPNLQQLAMVGGGSYNVFAEPLESPYVGPRTLMVDPADALASPFGWHDTDGATGAEYTTTQGNQKQHSARWL